MKNHFHVTFVGRNSSKYITWNPMKQFIQAINHFSVRLVTKHLKMIKSCRSMRKCMKFNKIFLVVLALCLLNIKDNWLNMKELTLRKDLFSVMFVQKISSPNHISKGTRRFILMNSPISAQYVLKDSDKLSIYRITLALMKSDIKSSFAFM